MAIAKLERLPRLLGLGAALLALAACLPERAEWSHNDTIKRSSVELVRFGHDVGFSSEGTQLSASEAERLNRFLSSARVGYGDRLAVDAGSSSNAKQRRAVLAAHLRGLGLTVEDETPLYGDAPAAGQARIIVSRHVVTPPPCPDWRKPSGPDYANTPSSNFGCATATNLGLMVADPADLVAGKELGPADAEYLAKAVDRYRQGKVKEPKPVTTAGSEGSSGGSNQGSSQ